MSLGFDYKSLDKVTELRKPIKNEKFERYMDLMANDTHIQDIESHLNVYETYTVSIIIVFKLIS